MIRGSSDDDCTESMCTYNLCQNSMCHSHSYDRVRKSSPGCAERKGSEALSEEVLDERKAEESACGSWHIKHTSVKCVASNKHEREEASADAIDNSGPDSSRSMRNKKIKLSKDIGFDLLTGTTVQEAQKPPRMVALKKNQECGRQKKRKISNWDGSYSVVIEWLNYYCVDESDEDEVPLINKRTKRRKRQKLLKNSQAAESNNGVWGANSSSHVINDRADSSLDSCSQGPRSSNSFENVPTSLAERLLPKSAGCHGVTGDQAHHEIEPSPLDSQMIVEIVDISDG